MFSQGLYCSILFSRGAEYFRLKNICDCQKELDNKIDQKDKSWKNMEGLNS